MEKKQFASLNENEIKTVNGGLFPTSPVNGLQLWFWEKVLGLFSN